MEFARNHVDRKVDCNDIARFPRSNVRNADEQQSLQQIFGIPFARLRELAEAEREGNIPKLNLGDKVYWLPDTLSFAFGNIAEATISMVSKGVKTLGWKYRIFTLPTPEHGGNKYKYQQDISEYDIGKHYFLTQAEAARADDTTGKVKEDEFMREAMYDQLHSNGN